MRNTTAGQDHWVQPAIGAAVARQCLMLTAQELDEHLARSRAIIERARGLIAARRHGAADALPAY